MSEQEAFDAHMARIYGDAVAIEMARDMERQTWEAALAWLRSQGEPVAWIGQFDGLLYREQADVGDTPLFLAPQPAIPDGWQPIATMPKDFEPFDVWSVRRGRIPDCVDGVTTYGKVRGIVHQDGYDSDGPVMEIVKDATHWMRVAAPEPTK